VEPRLDVRLGIWNEVGATRLQLPQGETVPRGDRTPNDEVPDDGRSVYAHALAPGGLHGHGFLNDL